MDTRNRGSLSLLSDDNDPDSRNDERKGAALGVKARVRDGYALEMTTAANTHMEEEQGSAHKNTCPFAIVCSCMTVYAYDPNALANGALVFR